MRKLISYAMLIAMTFGFLAFQCQSTEMTSAKLYIQQKNYPKAKESLLKEVKKNPKSDEGYYLLGWLYGEEGNYAEMLKAFDNSLSISKKFEKQIEETKRYHWAQNFNKGVGFFNKGAKADSEDARVANLNKAIEAFQNSIMIEPDSVVNYKNLAFAYLNTNQADKAIEPLQTLLKKEKSADVYVRLGEIYFNNGVAKMNKFLDSNDKADSLAAIDEYNKAIETLEQGRKDFPEDSDILLLLSNAYIKANKIEVAKDAFKAGVEQDPENKYYRYNYGVLLLGANEFAGAEEQFKKAIELDPEYENAIYNLAVTYVKWGSAMNEEAIAKGEDDDSYKEKYKAALPYLEKYLELKPNDLTSWELLGKVYANLGMNDKSMEAFKKADELR